MTESLAEELKDRGVTVNAVLPGIIFFATFRVDLAVDAAAFFIVRTAFETADFFFAFLAIVTSSI